MKIAILGTGMVGRAHAAKLTNIGHEVFMGTRDPQKTLAETKPDFMGNPPLAEWHKQFSAIKLETMSGAAKQGEVIINALNGNVAVDVLNGLQAELSDKILIDITNPLDFSKGMPPRLFVCNDDSLGEQIQRALPKTKVVKTLNTVNAGLQVDPKSLAEGDHHIFVSGADESAKTQVIAWLGEWYGWQNIIDLGDITTARGTEMLMPIWLQLMGSLGTFKFNYKIIKDK